jgi:hypothetical protein
MHETGMGQQLAQLLDSYMIDDDDGYDEEEEDDFSSTQMKLHRFNNKDKL